MRRAPATGSHRVSCLASVICIERPASVIPDLNALAERWGLGNRLLTRRRRAGIRRTGRILCEERLGGLLRHYYRKAA